MSSKSTDRKKRVSRRTTRKKASPARGSTVRSAPSRGKPRKVQASATQARAVEIIRTLKSAYPTVTCALHHDSALQLLIATILSAQSTDETVNRVTPVLFGRFPTAGAIAAAPLDELETIVHSTGFFRQKAKNIQATCRAIVEQFHGEVPDRMDALISLPGVARKTANVVLGTWFQRNDGVVVDTHVGRLATRLQLTWSAKDSKDAVKIEQDLREVVPQADWTYFSHALIRHGREVCSARKPKCESCWLAPSCPSAGRIDMR